MSTIENGWFREMSEIVSGYSVGLQVEEVYVQEKSKYQDILVFKSTKFGNVLVLDGCIQCTERDECCYQEMIAHLPLCCHANPKQVLVVGGGDGGVVREVLKHPSVEKVTLCEIDERVIEVCKKYLPNMARFLADPRVHVHIGDGVQFMKENKNSFDVIITDSPDPIGAAKGLFEREYYRCVRSALSNTGIICSQGENLWLDLELVQELTTTCRSLFPSVGYAFASMPTYAGGHIGFLMASVNPDMRFEQPLKVYTEEEADKIGLQFYNSQIHQAAFVLPQFAKKALCPNNGKKNGVHDEDT